MIWSYFEDKYVNRIDESNNDTSDSKKYFFKQIMEYQSFLTGILTKS